MVIIGNHPISISTLLSVMLVAQEEGPRHALFYVRQTSPGACMHFLTAGTQLHVILYVLLCSSGWQFGPTVVLSRYFSAVAIFIPNCQCTNCTESYKLYLAITHPACEWNAFVCVWQNSLCLNLTQHLSLSLHPSHLWLIMKQIHKVLA